MHLLLSKYIMKVCILLKSGFFKTFQRENFRNSFQFVVVKLKDNKFKAVADFFFFIGTTV